MRARVHSTVIATAALLAAAFATADGGTVRLRRDAGPFSITVFTSPEPLTAGPADVSVLVQDRESGAVLLDATVEIAVGLPGRVIRAPAVPARNRLLRAAAVDLPAAGSYEIAVSVRRADVSETVAFRVAAGAAGSGLPSVWPYVAFPPLAVAFFALRGRIRRRSTGALRRRAPADPTS